MPKQSKPKPSNPFDALVERLYKAIADADVEPTNTEKPSTGAKGQAEFAAIQLLQSAIAKVRADAGFKG